MSRKARHTARKLYCVIGYPIKHSLSPKLHNAAFRKLKIPARYEAVEVKPRDLAKFMRKYRKRYAGGNVTIPHKQAVMQYLDRISPEAKKIGAVNTIVNRGGKLIGYNTDAYGAMEALKKSKLSIGTGASKLKVHSGFRQTKGKNSTQLNGEKVVVFGAGGAARAVVYGLKQAGARVTILNRTLARAKKLAKDFGCEYMPWREGSSAAVSVKAGSNLLINTTSVGMWPEIRKTPLPNFKKFFMSGDVGKLPIVMDIIYRPRITQLLRDAKRAGCKIITGDHMFLAQAAKSFELWTGTSPKFPKL